MERTANTVETLAAELLLIAPQPIFRVPPCNGIVSESTMLSLHAPPLSSCRRFRGPRVERTQREGMFKKVLDRCKRQRHCPHCGEWNAVVK